MTSRHRQKSRVRLKEALMTLIRTKRYEEITVGEVLKLADVSRSTFYAHFTSKEDLLFRGFDEWLLSHGTDAQDGEPAFRFSLPFLEHIGGQGGMFKNSVKGPAGERVRRKLKLVLTGVVETELVRMNPMLAGSPELPPYVQMLTGAFLALSNWWQDEAPGTPVEKIDALFQQLTPQVG